MKKTITMPAAVIMAVLFGVALGRVTAPSDAETSMTTASTKTSAAATPDARTDDVFFATPGASSSRSAPRSGSVGAGAVEPSLNVVADDAGAERGQDESAALHAGRTLAACEAERLQQREVLALNERRRKELEGEPIAARVDTPARFQAAAMVQTFERAFTATKIVGKVESVDCTEHPCILFGRLQGDEEGVARLEDSEAFAAYDDDLGVMLTWASADLEHGGGTKPGLQREKPPEVSLFAFAYYTRQDREQHGELIDRRIRVRTAEYWNSSTVRE